MKITTGTARGCVDASLGAWTVATGILAEDDGRVIARIRAENIARGGFDIRPVLEQTSPAGFRAMTALYGSGRVVDAGVGELETVRKWLEAHPEAFGVRLEKPYDYIHPNYSPVRCAAIDLKLQRHREPPFDREFPFRELRRGWARMFPAPVGKLPA